MLVEDSIDLACPNLYRLADMSAHLSLAGTLVD